MLSIQDLTKVYRGGKKPLIASIWKLNLVNS